MLPAFVSRKRLEKAKDTESWTVFGNVGIPNS